RVLVSAVRPVVPPSLQHGHDLVHSFLYQGRAKDFCRQSEPIERSEQLEGRETVQQVSDRDHTGANTSIQFSRKPSLVKAPLICAENLYPCGFIPLPERRLLQTTSIQDEANRIQCVALTMTRVGSEQTQAGIIQGTKETLECSPLGLARGNAPVPTYIPVQR